MSKNLFRITVDEPNYSRVLKEPVELGDVRNLSSALNAEESVRLWAVKPGPGNANTYDRLQPDDALLFYLGGKYRPDGEGRYVAVGRVGKKFRGDEESGRELFRNVNVENMYTIEDFELISKTKKDIERILGYDADHGHPNGPHRVPEDRYSSVNHVMNELMS
ncbi:hypothetical protein [Halogranum rubrum]|uniref:EVE domain-containing protein n=1 Tax=Halogranum salarium B-1 TaxID=1210908 RepID=J2ZXN8_9EURY|nr:hypothetical protein [Halogranum salarium]EJN57783.1 hypothetical protein HSB1_38680 [Halogranum salarium B-1]